MSKAKQPNKSDKVSPELDTPTDLPQAAVDKISASLNVLLADAFALYMKTKNFHWHVSGPHFRDYHLMLDDQATQILATTDAIAERVRKTGNVTLPLTVFVTDAKRERISAEKMKVDVAVAVDKPIGYFSTVRTVIWADAVMPGLRRPSSLPTARMAG